MPVGVVGLQGLPLGGQQNQHQPRARPPPIRAAVADHRKIYAFPVTRPLEASC